MNPTIRVGVFDWCRFPQNGEFYPPDLPTEWRLDYFSNEFESACVDVQCLAEKPALIADWSEDLGEQFELGLYLSSAAPIQMLARVAGELQHRPHYLLFDRDESDILLQLKKYRQVLYAAGLDTLEQVIAWQQLWRPGHDVEAGAPIACLPGGKGMRQYREWIEQWLASAPQQQTLTLWLDGRTSSYQTLQDCRSLVELMGH